MKPNQHLSNALEQRAGDNIGAFSYRDAPHINITLRKVTVQGLKVQNESYLEEPIHNIKEFSLLQDSLVRFNPVIYPSNT